MPSIHNSTWHLEEFLSGRAKGEAKCPTKVSVATEYPVLATSQLCSSLFQRSCYLNLQKSKVTGNRARIRCVLHVLHVQRQQGSSFRRIRITPEKQVSCPHAALPHQHPALHHNDANLIIRIQYYLMSFQYTSIGSEELRLLKPISSVNKSDLQFEVSHVSRDQAPAYTAISYTWGDGEPTEQIHLDCRPFMVRPNLWSCLFRLRAFGKVYGWTHIWVDAICIDQTNDQERNAQVWSMDQTYKGAECVSVWLGEPAGTLHSEEFDWFKSMPELTRRPYWSRTWVIQEFLMGRRVKIFWGDENIDWRDFFELLLSGTPLNHENHPAFRLMDGRQFMDSDHAPFLYYLLTQHYNSICKDPRDRVFALLGIVGSSEKNQLGKLFPDYTLSEDHVAVITLAHCMNR
ncbi:heterokaryon incompatibility protein-domain-containing protein [Clohesyomyces aquaticus]|uniref:Heterokaryon incompatibility protein-domain-containing protein n=1 Tax=Clohesyomyces aquaticus TaxID=1231657 RepID=A0A1Y1YZU0_9PLEO|nr:heterokaryon incompatibility protein-domain-containing protein [Clohesyomyces aquaticus]